jgi:pimeloyl-ACP methyl ester carboxylesterase
MHSLDDVVLHSGSLEFTALQVGAGPLVLCLHGFPDNARSYRHQLPALADAGYHAVSVNLRGYEPTSQPDDNDYSMEAVAGDVVGFIDEFEADKAHLIGHDWGAAVAYTAGAMAPERFKSLTTMAVPHSGRFVNEAVKYPKQLALSWYMGFFQLRGVAEHFVQRRDYRLIRKLWQDWSPGWDIPDDVLQDVISTLGQPGVTKAALSYYRAALTPSAFTPSARAAARFAVSVPTLAITGERDGCIDSSIFKRMMYDDDFPGGLEVQQVAEAGHFPHQERPKAVNALILDWIRRWESNSSGEPE